MSLPSFGLQVAKRPLKPSFSKLGLAQRLRAGVLLKLTSVKLSVT